MTCLYFVEASILLGMVGMAGALSCYQNKNQSDEVMLVDNEEYVMCVYFPERRYENDEVISKPFATGLTVEEVEEVFEKFFKNDTPYYKVFSVCLYEKYNWPKVWRLHTNRNNGSPGAGHQFRCLCNTNLCNSAESFDNFLHGSSIRISADGQKAIV